MAKTKTTYNLGTATMSAAPTSGKTVYTMDDMNKKVQNEQNKINLAKALGVSLSDSYGFSPKVSETPVSSKATSLNDVLNNNYSSAVSDYTSGLVGSGGTGGYYTLDISNMLKAYEQAADTQRQIAESKYNTKREDLLNSLKRFQDQNARDVANQQRAYLSNQASLESAIAQADRQNRISAASRGLGGSGLQQLAQLQNLLSQGQTISNMATENQSVMDTLRRALAEEQENYDIGTSRALEDYNNTLSEIASNLALNKANAEVQRANSYIAPSGGLSAYEAQSYGNDLAGQLSTIVRAYQTAKKGTDNTTTYKQSLDDLDALGLPQNGALYNQAKNNLISIYKSKHSGKSPKY